MTADDNTERTIATDAGSGGVSVTDGLAATLAARKGGRQLDFVFGLIGTFLQVGTGVIMLPAVATSLTPSALTFWYVFLTIQTLAILIEFGFTPTLARNFTYVLAGAQKLQTEGVPVGVSGAVNPGLLANLLRASRRLYAGMALIVLVLLGAGGGVYLAALAHTTKDVTLIWPAWAVFIAALAVQANFNWQGCVIVGSDRVRQNYQVFIVARLTQVVLSLVGLYFFPNLLTLSVAYAISVLVGRVHARLVIRDVLKRIAHEPTDPKAVGAILRTIMPVATKLGWVTVGEFFTNRFSLFAVSLAVGAAAAAEYAITLQAMMVLLTVSQIATALSMPRMAAARLSGDAQAVRDLYAFCLVLSVTLLGCGSAAFIVLGEPILRAIGSGTMLPSTPVLVLLGVIYTVSVNAHTAMNVITSGNRVPQLRAVLLTGAATTLGVIIVAMMKGNLIDFVAVQGVTQLAFNFWRWPIYAFTETGLTVGALWRSAIAGGRRIVLGHP